MTPDYRDLIITTLLASNRRRAAWPISAVLPLLATLKTTISYQDFVQLIATTDGLDSATHRDAKNLKRKMFEKDDTRPTVTAWEHYTRDFGEVVA